MSKPLIKLVGEDGNAFAIIGKVRQAAKKNGFSQETISNITNEMMSGDYDNLLATVGKYFDIE